MWTEKVLFFGIIMMNFCSFECFIVSFNIFAGICKLNIKNMDTKDGGEYSCEAVNSIGKDITRCRVQVTGIAFI